MAKVIKVENGALSVNSYVCYYKGGDCFLVDPSDGFDEIISKVKHFNLNPKFIILTHGHCDHISGVEGVSEAFDIPVYAFTKAKTLIENPSYNLSSNVYGKPIALKDVNYLEEGKHTIGELEFELIHTPGHSAGSSCILVESNQILFTGDLLFKQSIGRTDLPTGNQKVLFDSLKKLKRFSNRLVIYPGHGPRTTLRDEIKDNPYLKV